ncbi:MAG: TldD/PmbA family protein [Bacillota bacterium]
MNFEQLFDKAKASGLDSVQVFLEESKQLDLEVFKGELEKHQMADSRSLTITGIYNGKMGRYKTEVINLDNVDDWIQELIKSASLIESQDEVFIYKGSDSYEVLEGLFQEPLETTDVKDKIKMVFDLEEKLKARDERIDISEAFYGQVRKHVLLQNSKGLKLEKDVNSAVLGAHVVARENDDSRSAFDYVQSNELGDFDLEEIAIKTVDKAVSQLGSTPIPSGKYEIILENNASASLLAAHASMFSGESVQKGMSKLIDKVGEKVANKLITIVDDPFRPKSPKSGSFDDEGVRTDFKEMVSKGKLTGYLHNLKTAKKAGTESTGNGFRGGVSPTNFYIRAGASKYDDLVKNMEKGLIITDLQGTHSGTNPISADFSLQANGYYVENGKITKPVALITVAGNYLSLLQDVEAVCDDLKMGFSFIGSPSLKIKSLMVSGE